MRTKSKTILDNRLSRRSFLRTAAGTGTTFFLLPYTGCKVTETAVPGAFLTKEQRQAAQALANVILPADGLPGAGDLGVVDYLEQLLGAFDTNPPRIYAAGPYSGRNPFTTLFPGEAKTQDVPNGYKNFVPLTRNQEAAWRLYLFGSDGVPGGGPNDHLGQKVTGLRTLVPKGLNQAIKLCPGPIDKVPHTALDLLLRVLDGKFYKAFSELVIESAFAAPEYGGNRELLGWRIAHFEGDVHPWGYTYFDQTAGAYRERPEAPVSTLTPGPDVDPLTLEVRLLLDGVALIEGRLFKLKKPTGETDPSAIHAAAQALEGESP